MIDEHIEAGAVITGAGFTQTYEHIVMGWVNGNNGSHNLIVVTRDARTGIRALTDSRRITIGRKLFELTGAPMHLWEGSSDAERIRWSHSHMERYPAVRIDYDTRWGWSYTTPGSNGSSYDDDHFHVVALEDLS